jgi:hypothetical protein
VRLIWVNAAKNNQNKSDIRNQKGGRHVNDLQKDWPSGRGSRSGYGALRYAYISRTFGNLRNRVVY